MITSPSARPGPRSRYTSSSASGDIRTGKSEIRRFERAIQQLNEESDFHRDTHQAVESSLLAQVSNLTAQIADLEAQVNPLRDELSKYQQAVNQILPRSNPLPPPPEPIPLDRFPPFARATAESKDGYAAYFTPGRAADLFPINLPPADPPAGTSADKGKGKAKQPPYSMYVNPTGNVIIPGATPSQRVIPGDDAAENPYYSHAPASAYVDGYASGYGQGYGAANAGMAPDTNHASTSAYQLPPHEHDDSLEETFAGSLRLSGMPSASEAAIAPVVSRPPESAPAIVPPRRRPAYFAAPSHASTADDTSISSQADTSYMRPSALRRSTVQLDGHLSNGQAPSAWHQPPIYAYAPPAHPAHYDATVRFDTQAQDANPPPTHETTARRAVQDRQRVNRQSYSSWGTVHTNSPAGTRGSLSEIGDIANFPRAPAFPANEILERGLVATPRQEFDAPPPEHARPGHVHSYSLPRNAFPILENADAAAAYDASSLQRATHNNRQRTVPRRFSQLPTGVSEFGEAPLMMPAEPPPIQNALGIEFGVEAASGPPAITAPTPRVQLTHMMRSWSLDPTVS
ncbi:hypothetical protein B0H19DRAFT_619302 [Mycena capillaripes]|nr:hypothetical protein B0H19DRAFT_619302 [Mycena capillaripes]